MYVCHFLLVCVLVRLMLTVFFLSFFAFLIGWFTVISCICVCVLISVSGEAQSTEEEIDTHIGLIHTHSVR